MTRIGPIPPSQPPLEPEEPYKKGSPNKPSETSSSQGSHKAKLRRFAKAQGLRQVLQDVPSPIRHQWNENHGYCGEACMIASLLMFGGYMSQFTARQLAGQDPNDPSYFDDFDPSQPQTTCQLLLGDNDQYVAAQMGLSSEVPPQAQTQGQGFLNWIKSEVSQGHPVMIGVYENQSKFGQSHPDAQYDHIVTVTQITDTTITFHDNGLYGKPPQDTITIPLSQFLQTRDGANSSGAPIYSLCSDGPCYGLAITGINDPNHETLPVSVAPSSANEPDVEAGDSPAPMTLTPTVSGLTVGKQYVIYQYNGTPIPSSNFNANSKGVTKYVFTATSSTMTLPPQTINSSDTAIFRCVPVDGP